MDSAISTPTRRPRFQRAADPLPFRITDGDIEIVRQIARYRFLRSTHVAVLVGRSLDRTNDRLLRLFHSRYIDRPRAQLDYYPTSGSAPMVYALADRGARILAERFGVEFRNSELSRKNDSAGRGFIEHQLEIVYFQIALQLAVRGLADIRLIHSDELISAFPQQTRSMRTPLALRATILRDEKSQEVGVIPDLIFGLGFPDGSKRCFMVEVDRGTMPIQRSDLNQTSIERKMLAYLSLHATGKCRQQFGWNTFRVLIVTRDQHRLNSMLETVRLRQVPGSLGPALFLFALRDDLRAGDPISHSWCDGSGHSKKLAA